jgi:hypothetical protein
MSTLNPHLPQAGFADEFRALNLPSFSAARLAVARSLVAFCFVWPFFNFAFVVPDNAMEIDFLPVFLAAALLPKIAMRQKLSILLAMPVFAVALFWANPAAPLRLAIGIIPLHFVLNLTRHLRERGQDLVPANLAYRCLQVFIAFCVIQTVQINVFAVIPEWLTDALTAIIPRYMAVAYDDLGIRGVQGWASEPSSAGLMCLAFALVAIAERPDRRWRVLAFFALLVSLNKSIYCLILMVLLGFACAFTVRRKIYSFLTMAVLAVGGTIYAAHSGRFAELSANIAIDGLNRESNHELMRFLQILNPLEQFPHVYQPMLLNGTLAMEPMGLLPLVVGYGSVAGLLWLGYMLWHNFPRGLGRQLPLTLVAVFVLLIMAPPDLIPSVVAVAVLLNPKKLKPGVASTGAFSEGVVCAADFNHHTGV